MKQRRSHAGTNRRPLNRAGQRCARTWCLALIFLALSTAQVAAQYALDGYDAALDQSVSAMVMQLDGKVLIAGGFTQVLGQPRDKIARLNQDGTLDTSFVGTTVVGAINAVAVRGDKIVIGGSFQQVGGQPRNNIARLNSDGTLDSSFDPGVGPNFFIYSVAIQADGRVLAGGGFNQWNNQPRGQLVRLDTSGNLEAGFPQANNNVWSMVVLPSGRIVVGGAFSQLAGQPRSSIGRLNPDGTLDGSFNPGADSTVQSIAVQPDGKLVLGGWFTQVAGQPRERIARLFPNGTLDSSLTVGADQVVYSVFVQPDGKILLGGSFFNVGLQPRLHIARLNANGTLETAFNPGASQDVRAFAVQPADNKVLVGGLFDSLGGQLRNYLGRLYPDGSLDATLTIGTEIDTFVFTIAHQPDGKILLGGAFDELGGQPRAKIGRVNPDGTLDSVFNPGATGGVVNAIALQPDGRIVVAGTFTQLAGQARTRLGRLLPDGALDTSFADVPVDGEIFSLAVQEDGRILLTGNFDNVGIYARARIARLNENGSVDTSFNPGSNGGLRGIVVTPDGNITVCGGFNSLGGAQRLRTGRLLSNGGLDPSTGLGVSLASAANSFVIAIAVQPNGSTILGGQFTQAGMMPRERLARFDSAGNLEAFNPGADGNIRTLALLSDGKVMAGGAFNFLGGDNRPQIGRLNADGTLDDYNAFIGGVTNGNVVDAITVQPDGKVLLGGSFSSYGGQTRRNFARFLTPSPISQELSVNATRDRITWLRSGRCPEVDRVTFELSTDGVNYQGLGPGTRIDGGWQLATLLSANLNLFVRARGFYQSGGYPSGTSILETVWNVFITATPLQLTTVVSRKTHDGAGDFDINLPLTGEPAVECRSSGGIHTFVFTFNSDVVSGNATVTTGTGSVSGSPTFAANTMTLNLSGVADVQKITLTLSGVTDSFGQVLPDTAVSINMLIGDTNGNKTVNASDIGQTKGQSGVPVTSSNFRQDVTPNGTINASDIGFVKSRSGAGVP